MSCTGELPLLPTQEDKETWLSGLVFDLKKGRVLVLFRLEKRRFREVLIAAFQYPKRAYKKDGGRCFTKACSDKKRDTGFKMKESWFRFDIRNRYIYKSIYIYIMVKVAKHWNKLPRRVVNAPSSVQSKVGCGLKQPDLVKYVPNNGQGLGTK